MKRVRAFGIIWVWLIFGFWLVAGWINGLASALTWLGWLPDAGFLLLAVPGVIAAVLPAPSPGLRKRLALLALPFVVLLVAALLHDWRPWPVRTPTNPENVVRIAFINASHPAPQESIAAATALLGLGADVILITDPAGLHGDLEQLADGHRVAGTFKVSVVSDQPIASLRPVHFSSTLSAVEVTLDGHAGTAFTVLVVDLPAAGDPAEIASELREVLNGQGSSRYDLVVGDFNMTPRSNLLSWAMEGYENAFEVEGVGWGATWPGTWPLLRIDHAFVLDGEAVLRAETFDAGARPSRARGCV